MLGCFRLRRPDQRRRTGTRAGSTRGGAAWAANTRAGSAWAGSARAVRAPHHREGVVGANELLGRGVAEEALLAAAAGHHTEPDGVAHHVGEGRGVGRGALQQHDLRAACLLCGQERLLDLGQVRGPGRHDERLARCGA